MYDISTIIPVYNCEAYIAEALDSALNQTDVRQEIIVVNDGSKDGTEAILREYEKREIPNLRVIHQPNAGFIAARNRGVAEATGSWLAFLDSDDAWSPNKLALQWQKVQTEAFPNLAVVYTERLNVGAIDCMKPRQSESQTLYEGPGELMFTHLLDTNFITVSSSLVRKDVYDLMGGFDAEATGCEDWDLWLRISGAGYATAVICEPLTQYRWLENAMSRNIRKMHHGRTVALTKALQTEQGKKLSRSRRNQAFAAINEISGWVASMSKHRREALYYYLHCLWYRPFQWSIYKQILKQFLP